MRTKSILFIWLYCCLSFSVFARQDKVVQLDLSVSGWDNVNFGICWYNENDIYNIGSRKFCSPGKVSDVKVSPAHNAFVALYEKSDEKKAVSLYDYATGSHKHTFSQSKTPTAITYTANARYICIADRERQIKVYNATNYTLERAITTTFIPKKLVVSPNNYFIAAPHDTEACIWDFEKGTIRQTLNIGQKVVHIAFSPDNSKMSVLSNTGKLYIYNAKTFLLVDTYNVPTTSKECHFHYDGKYLSAITASNQITIINMKDPVEDRQAIDTKSGGIKHIGFARTVMGVTCLAYNYSRRFVFHHLDYLIPNYQLLIQTDVIKKMDIWLKQLSGESISDYHNRVNDETRPLQSAQFENEAATKYADNKVQKAKVSFGNYNKEQNLLEMKFDNMPSIYLPVPQDEVTKLSTSNDLVFENSVYAVTDKDDFELLYTEVIDNETKKKYIFNNLEKKSFDFLADDENFVPLELIQQSSQEEAKLQAIREQVVSAAQQASLISEHTHIDVNTKVEASTDADGKKIMNYAVEFHYNVEHEFSSKEDFGAGKYVAAQSQSALAMLHIVQNAFNSTFKQYIQPGKKVLIQVTGSADASPIKSKIAYNNEYGVFAEELIYLQGELSTISVNKASGITTNEQLAFLRAMGVKDYIQKNIPGINDMNCEYDTYVNVSSERGAEFRRIGVKFTFVDVF